MCSCHEEVQKVSPPIEDPIEISYLINNSTNDTIPTNQLLLFNNKGKYLELSKTYLSDKNSNIVTTSNQIKSNKFPIKLIETTFYDPSLNEQNLPNSATESAPPRIIPVVEVITPVIEPEQIAVLPMAYKDNAQFDIQYLNVEQGLPSEDINTVIQDKRGFIWFGTKKGLVRYDGNFIKTYDKHSGLIDESINSVTEDHDGNIWMGTEKGYLIKYDGIHFRSINSDSIVKSNPITYIKIDKNNVPWFIVQFGGFANYNSGRITSYMREQGMHTNRPASSIDFDKAGRTWITAYGTGLYVLDKTGLHYVKNNINQYVNTCFVDKDDKLWIGPWHNTYQVLEGDSLRTYKIVCDFPVQINSFKQDSQGKMWAFAGDSYVFKLDDDIAYCYGEEHGISGDIISSICLDQMDRVWITTYGGGVCRFNSRSFSALNKYSGYPNGDVYDIKETFDGRFLLGTQSGLYEMTDSVLTGYDYIETFNADKKPFTKTLKHRSYEIEYTPSGDIMVAVNNSGVHILKEKHAQIFGGAFKGGPQNVRCIDKTENGTIWIGAFERHGLYRRSNDSLFQYDINSGIYLSHITSIETVSESEIWFGSIDEGVGHIIENEVIYYNTSDGLYSNTINQIYNDHSGMIWISTPKGLNYFEDNKLKKVIFNQSDLPQEIMAVVQDHNKGYWITLSNGIVHLTPLKELTEHWNINNYEVNWLTRENGIINTNFYPNSLSIDSKNRLLAGSKNGLIVKNLNHAYDSINNSPPLLSIESIKINGQHIDFNQDDHLDLGKFGAGVSFHNYPSSLQLPYHANEISFQYYGINWNNPRSMKFEYYLEGLENEWNDGGLDNIGMYVNLNSGNYTFHLRMKLGNETIGKELNYSFEILPPWWLLWWVKSLFGLMIIGLILIIIRWRTYRLKMRQKELEYEVKNATLEIREQKEEIETAHREITDSIAYAKRIQNAILPSIKSVKEYLTDSFIFYKPKDIVAGDFYWVESFKMVSGLGVGQAKGILFAAADCTGHGVPGALMSVVCNNALNRSVREFGLTDPGLILDRTRTIIIEEFGKADEAVMDGMDISLCCLKGKTLTYAGAYNPLWIIRNGKMIVIEANRQPIGEYIDLVPFTTHKIELRSQDVIYLFTDGYVDQFGGEKGKKFKRKSFKELLLNMADLPMQKQFDTIDTFFDNWRGDLDQIDDICIIGVRI